MVIARQRHGLGGAEVIFENVEQHLEDGGDDPRAAGAADREEGAAVSQDDGRRHARERPFLRANEVRVRLPQAVGVDLARLGREIVHLVVHDNAETINVQ